MPRARSVDVDSSSLAADRHESRRTLDLSRRRLNGGNRFGSSWIQGGLNSIGALMMSVPFPRPAVGLVLLIESDSEK